MKSDEGFPAAATMTETIDRATTERGVYKAMLKHMFQEILCLRKDSQRLQDALGVRFETCEDKQTTMAPDSTNALLLMQAERISQLENQMKEIKEHLQMLCLAKQDASATKVETEYSSLARTDIVACGMAPNGNEYVNESSLIARHGPVKNSLKHTKAEKAEDYASLARGRFDAGGLGLCHTLASGTNGVAHGDHDEGLSRPESWGPYQSKVGIPPANLAPPLEFPLECIEMNESEDDMNSATASGPSGSLGSVGQSDAIMCIPPTTLAPFVQYPYGDSDSTGDMSDLRPEDVYETKKRSTGQKLALSNEIRASPISPGEATTAMIRNIACRYKAEDVKMVLDAEGFHGKYDYVNVPTKYSSKQKASNLGYCFVNFLDPRYVVECAERFDGKLFGNSLSTKICHVTLAEVQGSEPMYAPREKRATNKLAQSPHLHELVELVGETVLQRIS